MMKYLKDCLIVLAFLAVGYGYYVLATENQIILDVLRIHNNALDFLSSQTQGIIQYLSN